MFNAFLKAPWVGVGVGIFLQVHYLLYLLSKKIPSELSISFNEVPIIPGFVPILGGKPLPFFSEPITMPFQEWCGWMVLVLGGLFLVPQFFFGGGRRPKPRLWNFYFSALLMVLLFYKVF